MANQTLDKMKELVRTNNTCVLATTRENKPHCSLMAYVADEECSQIFMATHRDTSKYRNLLKNPNVSLLIDTRAQDPGEETSKAKALTVAGAFQGVEDAEKRGIILQKLMDGHPHLKDFLQDPDAEMFSVKIESFLLLEGVANAYFELA